MIRYKTTAFSYTRIIAAENAVINKINQSPYCDQGEKMNKILQTEDFEDWKTVSTEKLIKLHHKAVDYRNAKNKEYIEARDREIEMQQELNSRFGILSEEKE
jgi:hypothetical protein